jgi:hypothetical protein
MKKMLIEKSKEEIINSTKPPSGYSCNSAKYASSKFEKEFLFISRALMEDTENLN